MQYNSLFCNITSHAFFQGSPSPVARSTLEKYSSVIISELKKKPRKEKALRDAVECQVSVLLCRVQRTDLLYRAVHFEWQFNRSYSLLLLLCSSKVELPYIVSCSVPWLFLSKPHLSYVHLQGKIVLLNLSVLNFISLNT